MKRALAYVMSIVLVVGLLPLPAFAAPAPVLASGADASHKESRELAALGHNWGAGTVTTPPTTSAEGTRTYTCTACELKRTEAVPKLDGGSSSGGGVPAPAPAAKVSLSKAKMTLAKKTYVWTGKAKKPAVKVSLDGKALKKGVDFTVSYAKGCKNVGSYKVTVAGKGTYVGSKTLTFKVIPKATSLKRLESSGWTLSVSWKRQPKQTSGFQVQYATSKSFKGAKLKSVRGAGRTKLKLVNLKPGKRYYVRVRAYKQVGAKKYYSRWSTAKPAKTVPEVTDLNSLFGKDNPFLRFTTIREASTVRL